MVYKRFIKKDGKFYGPYEYKSVKQDGKVISEYVGKGVKKELRKKIICSKNCFYAIMILLGILILLQVFVVDLILTGKATLTTEKTYFPGEQITGSVKLILSEGELIPASSKVVIDNSGDVREFLLSDFLGNETSEGNYHIHEKGISGYGSGYGVLGERIIYPEVDFVLKIVDDVSASGEIISEVAENQSEEIVAEESEVVEESPSESPSIITGEIVDEVENSDSISGSVSKENSFLYNLPDGKTVEIVSSENEINVEVKDGILTVTTDYSEIEEGYGAGFYGKKETEYNINLDELNITANEGIFSVNIFYNEENLVSVQEKINIDYGENETSEIIFAENLTNETIVTNITNETIINLGNTSLKIDTTQYGAVVGMPVKWKKKITAENVSNITVELPKEAENVNVYEIPTENVSAGVDAVSQEITNSGSVSITGQASAELSFGEKSSIVKFFKKIFRSITGRAIDVQEETDTVIVNIDEVNDSVAEYEISYETPAPISIEENISNGKRVIISSDVHYENILAYSELPYEISLNKIKLYYYDDVTGEKVLTNFDAYDSNGDLITGSTPEEKGYENVSVNDLVNVSAGEIPVEQNLVSFITWIVPHTSNQTYEIIIDITNAEHLDSNRTLIENIYNDVKSRDGVWSPTINNGEYVRVTFEQSLTSENDITIYAKSADKNSIANVEIYRENGDERISVIENVSSEGYYKTYLTGLNENENFFDLKIISLSGVEFDYIVDPYTLNLSANGTGSNMTVEPEEIAHLNISDGSLVLYMPFDAQENSEISKTYDYTNNSNDGTLNEEITFNSTGGVYSSGAYYFSGANNGNINLGNSSILKPENFSISLWVRTNVSGNNLGIFTNLDSTANHRTGYSLTRNTLDKIEFRTGDDTNTISNVLSTTIINDGLWYHVVAVYNGTMYLFINGIQEGTPKTVAMQYDELPVYIGSYYASSPALLNMNGSIDEVMMFNRSLSATEIMQIYNSTYSRFYPTGELLFQNLNFGERDKVNMTLNSCQQLNGSSFQGKINDGDYQNFSGCSLGDYLIPGDKTSANLTVKFLASAGNFYSPLVIGNVSVTEFRNDTVNPSVVISSPANDSYVNSVVKFDADISDSSGNPTYTFINDTNLIGYWTFDSTNSTGVYDTSGKNNFGRFNRNLSQSNLSTARFGDGLSFDGVDDYVDFGDIADFDSRQSHSYSVWIKANQCGGTYCAIVGDGFLDSVNGSGIYLISASGNLVFQARNGATLVSATATGNYFDNSWHHVAGIRDQTTNFTKLFVDGVMINNVSGYLYNFDNVRSFFMGSNTGSQYYFNGSIDEVLIFNRSLSADEIKALYNSSSQKFNVSYTLTNSGANSLSLVGVDTASNINLTALTLNNDLVFPQINFESPTPENNSYTKNSVTIVANVSDSSGQNGSSFIDFDRSLIGYWSFDSYNSTGIYDNSSYGNFGTFTGTGFGSSHISQGARGNGLSFDGSDDYVSIGDLPLFEFKENENFSVFVWIKVLNTTGVKGIVYKGAPGGATPGWHISMSGNRFYSQVQVGSTRVGTTTSACVINSNEWYLVGAVFNRNENAINYINANSCQSYDISSVNGDLASNIVLNLGLFSNYFNGSMDDVMIFNRSLSQSEINALYNSQANKFSATFTGLATGQHNYTLYGVDGAGNVNTSTQNFVVDTEKPVIEFVSPTENDGVTISNPYTYINTSITDNYNSDKSAWIDWDNTLVGYWSFDSYNSTGVFDNSSYGNFGTFTGGIGSSNISQGARGNGLSFDGDGDYVNSISNLGISGNFTLSAWIYPTNVDGYHRIIASRFNDYSFLLNGNKLAYQILNTGHANLSVGSINTNVWTHVLVSFDSSSGRIKFYIDGVEDLSEHTDLRVPSGIEVTFVNIGSTWAGQYFNGSIDEVMIFNRTLSATEISALYNNSAYRYENNFTNLADKGIYNYSVYAIDAGGNLNVTDSRSLDVNLDATAPQITIALPVAGNTYTSADVTFQVTTNENSTCNYSTDSFATNNSMTRNDEGTIHTATATLASANYIVNYSCADLYDNVNSSVGTNFVVSVSSGSSGTTGSSGSGGGGATTTTQDNIKVGIDSIERTLALNKIEFGQIEIHNAGEGNKTFSVSVETINSLIEFEESKITVGAGDSKNFKFRITPPTETGIYTGKIIIVSGSYVKTIPVTLNIRTEKSLYDLIVTIPKSMKVIEPMTNLVSQIDLLQMGIKEKMDVTLNYVIKDFTGKVYFSESETIAVENQKTLEKEFHTSDLPDGEYVLGVELIYPGGVAVASSHFKIGQKSLVQKNNIFMILILCALVFVAITIYFVTRKYRRMLKAVRKK